MTRQLLQTRLRTNLLGGTGAYQRRGSYVHRFVGDNTLTALRGWTGFRNCSPVTHLGLMAASGSNFVVGSSTGTPTKPADVDGLTVFYLGSFGQFYWNLRLGAGDEKLPASTQVRVQLGGSQSIVLDWSVGNLRYESTTTEDLWAVLGADLGENVLAVIEPL